MEHVIFKNPVRNLIKILFLNCFMLLFLNGNAICHLQSTNFSTSVNGSTVTIALSGGGYTSYIIGWGDVTYGTTLNHTYTSTGTKTICIRFTDSTANGICDTTICKTVTIANTTFNCPIQGIGFSTTVSGNMVTLTKTGSGYNSYLYTYGDGSSGTSNTHTYTTAGVKEICLRYQYVDSTNTARHCDTTICHSVTIANNFVCPIQNINFGTSVNGSIVMVTLTGDGYNSFIVGWGDATYYTSNTNGSGTTITHQYSTSGTKTICVKFRDSTSIGSCDSTICKTITIPNSFVCQLHNGNFTATVSRDTVRLVKSGTGYTSYKWSYGDGTYGTSDIHVYSSTGMKNVCLRLVDSTSIGSCDTTICKQVGITAQSFVCALHNNNYTTNVQGNSVSITLAGTGYTSILVGWGDGTYNTSLTHTYTTSGTKTMCVRFRDSTATGLCDTTVCKTIVINNTTCTWPNLFTSISDSCTASNHSVYGYSTLNACYKYQWKVNGVTVGTTRTLTYPVTQNGAYAVCLYITDTCTHCDTSICSTRNFTCISNTVPCNWQSRNPYVNFWDSCTTTNKSLNGYIYFGNTANACYKYQWKVNGVLAGTTRPFTYPITQNGTYTICVSVIDTCNHCDTTFCSTRTITCFNNWVCPIQGIGFNTAVSGNTVTLTKTGSGYNYYTWIYGDGTSGTSNTHTYTSSGLKEICLRYQYVDTTNTARHCDTTICHTVTIANNLPFVCPLHSANFTTNVNGNIVIITLTGGDYNSFIVGWGDATYYSSNTNGSVISITHQYSTSGTKTICVKYIASFANGSCDTTVCKNVTVTVPNLTCPIQGIGFTAQVNGNSVTLTKTGSGYNYYTWIYGDGTSGTSNTHTYTSSGVKEICLRYAYYDSTNTARHCDTTICHTITIAPTFVCPLHSTNFTTSVNGNTVSITLSGGDYNSHFVGWGDGIYNTESSHTYSTAGTKNICVRFKDSTSLGSCDTTICKTVTLTNPAFTCPIQGAGFTAQVNGNIVTLTKTGSGYNSYTWIYGDGTSGTGSPHTYTTAGVKEICLRYQYVDSTNTPHHCDTTICHTITIANNLPFVCALQNTNYTMTIHGNTVTVTLSGSGYNSYIVSWGDVTYGTALTHTYSTIGTKTICVRFRDSTATGMCDTTICKNIGITSLCDSLSCVLPGDADHDLTVNNFDIFAIGLSYNRTGLTRPNATTQYVLQPAPDWGSTHYYGFNDKFSDCNGDGTIKNTDASVILQNYIVKPLNHFNHRLAQDSLPPVFLAFDSLPIFQIGNPCNTTEIASDINVGTADQMANNVYGIGFSVEYPESFVSDSCFRIQIDLDANSWFATNEPILYLYKNIPEFHRVDVGIARTNGIARSGNGRIGRIKFVVEDGIFINGRTSTTKQYTFTVNNVGAIDGNGVNIGMIGRTTNAVFIISGIKTNKIEGLKIYPNPVTNYLNISANEILDKVSVTDISGQVIYTESINAMNKIIDFSSLSKGMYLIEISSKNSTSITKIIKSE